MRRGNTGFGLLDARAGREQLGFSDIDRALRLRQFFLIGPQRAGRGVGIGFCRIVLLLGNFALVEQRFIARQVRLRQLSIGFALLDVGLRPSEIRGARLVIGDLRAFEVGHCSGQLRIRAGGAAGDILARARYIHSRGRCLALCQS